MSKRQKKDSQYYSKNGDYSEEEEDYTADFESYDFGVNGPIESDLKQFNNFSYTDAYEDKLTSKTEELNPESICRDYIRNGCRRGRKCKFKHLQNSNYFQTFNISESPNSQPAVQYEVNFCHDYQNNGCNRPQCKFIHCSRSEQDFYYATGILLTTISCNPTNNIPVQYCKDFLSTGCTRLKCKYLHLTKEELEQAVFNQLNPSNNTNANNLESIVVNKTNPPPIGPPTYLPPPAPLPPTLPPQQFTVSVPMITTNLQQYNPASILSCSGIPPQPQHSSNLLAAMSAPSIVLPTNAAPTQASTGQGANNKEDDSASTQHQQQVVYGNIIHHHHAAPSAAAATGPVCALISSENHHLSLPVAGTTSSTITTHHPQPPQSAAAAHNLLTNHQTTSKQQPTSVTMLPTIPQSICTQKNTIMPVAETLSFTANNPPPTVAPMSMSLISMAPPCSILSAATTSPDIVTGLQHQQHPQIQSFQIAPSPSLSSSVSVTPIVNFDNKSHTQIIDPYSKLMQENEALKKRLLDLETANELLLDQNARLRHVKSSEISISQSPTISSISNNHIHTMGPNNNMINKTPCCQGSSTTPTNSGPGSVSVSSLIFNNPNTSTNFHLSTSNTTTTTTSRQHHTTTHTNSRQINNNTSSAEMATITLTLPLPTQTTQNLHKTKNNKIINQTQSNNSTNNKNNSMIISNQSKGNSNICVNAANIHDANKNMNSTNCNNLSKTTQLTTPAHVVDNTMATQSCLVTSAIQKIEKTVMPTLQALIGRIEDDQQHHHQYYNKTINYDSGDNNNNEDILMNKNSYCEHLNSAVMTPKQKSHEDQYDSNKLKNNQIDIEVPIRSSSCPSVTICSNQHFDGNATKFLNKNSNHPRLASRVRSIYNQNSTSLASTQTCFQ